MTRTQISVTRARRHFVRRDKSSVKALDDVSFDVESGEFLVLLGPSGCGKSTLLRAIAGLEQLDSGAISLDGRTVVDTDRRIEVPTENRQLSMMFQSYALWPHMTVAENIAYPLKARNIKKAATKGRVNEVLASVGIPELESQYPGQISGGQAQRVALARALVSRDNIVLFDEPLSNVDAKVREHLRAEIAQLHRESGFTAVYVTHDQEEALTLASRIFVLRNGKIVQSGTPQDIYDRPNSRYVAQFMGSVNELTATYTGGSGEGPCSVETSLGRIEVEYPDRVRGALTVFSRPEAWAITRPDAPSAVMGPRFSGVIREVVFLGSVSDIRVDINGTDIVVRSTDRQFTRGDHVVVSIESGRLIGRPDADEFDDAPVIASDDELELVGGAAS
ncbi:ABC transporter ATP-binding protein [Nocardia sp. NPDC058518]|uniref:ABC transporter ATP-binding protein n=1 Tax=Nocardia sp. NPDC058518 TaxID=3346534 RepID=UPI00365A8A5F